MSSFSPTRSRSPLGRRMAFRGIFGRATSAGPNFAFLAAFLVPLWVSGLTACDSDDDSPAEPAGVGGAADMPDASVRDLPGDGLQQTPEFDIDSRQRDPIGPEELTERINELQNDITGGGATTDAGNPGGQNSGDPDAGDGTN